MIILSILISSSELKSYLDQNPDCIVLDCRSDLANRNNASKLFIAGHIKTSIHAHLEDDLSGKIIPNETGRHPLPSNEEWQETLRSWGIEKDSSIVVYDQKNSMFAARAWWMLKWAGINNVKVLDGGLQSWIDSGEQISTDQPDQRKTSTISIEVNDSWTVSKQDIMDNTANYTLIDARSLTRYRGDLEPLDNKAGHIPNAINVDFTANLNAEGTFLSAEKLASRFESLANQASVVSYCGSGVTACHNILAISIAGIKQPQLYPGSWSEWITQGQTKISLGVEGKPL